MIVNVKNVLMSAAAGVSLMATVASADTFALVQINQQALFFNQMNSGAESAATSNGDKLVIFNANNDPAAQNSAIETYIQQGVDGIVIVAIDVNGIMPAVKQATDAGIPVVAVDAVLPDGPHSAQVGVNNAKAGADMGDFFLSYLGSDMGGSAKIGVVGALSSSIQNIRQAGFVDKITGANGVVEAGVVDGRNVQDIALTAAENLITANPDMTAIYATGDLTAQAIRGIDQGYVAAVIQQDPAGMGAAAVNALNTITEGGSVDTSISVPITIVTQANVDDFRSIFE